MGEIEDYKQAYRACHGEDPVIEKNGSWLAINPPFPLKVRKGQLPAMTSHLRYITAQKQSSGA